MSESLPRCGTVESPAPIKEPGSGFSSMALSERNRALVREFALPALMLALGAVVLFYNALRFSLPLGYAGLYAQAASQIAAGGLGLPSAIHLYGPGDIPFAYPPLALYAMALALKLGISPFTYLRFVPPLLSFLALIPLYLLGERVTHSRFGASMAVGLCAVSPALYAAHTWAAGVVRALAFLLLLLGLYVFDRAIRQDRAALPALAGLLFALVFLTHLYYALFLTLCAFCWLATNPTRRSVRAAAASLGVAAVLVAPWSYVVLARYGAQPFLSAWFTHGNTTFLNAASQPSTWGNWMAGNLEVLTAFPVLFFFVALGLASLAARRELTIPLLFLLTLLLFSPEGARFMMVLGAWLAGASWQAASAWLSGVGWATPVSQGLLALVALAALWFGAGSVYRTRPQLQDGAIQLASYVRAQTPGEARYVILATANEAEWFPYLFQREPLASKWGAEWLGTYFSASGLVGAISNCWREEDVNCLKTLNLDLGSEDILITHKSDKALTLGLESQPSCPQLGVFRAYIVWKAGCLSHGQSAEVTP